MYIFLAWLLVASHVVQGSENPVYIKFQDDPATYTYDYNDVARFKTVKALIEEQKTSPESPLQLNTTRKEIFECLTKLPVFYQTTGHEHVKQNFKKALELNSCNTFFTHEFLKTAIYLDIGPKSQQALAALYADDLKELFPREQSWQPKEYWMSTETGERLFSLFAGCILNDLLINSKADGLNVKKRIDAIKIVGSSSSPTHITYIKKVDGGQYVQIYAKIDENDVVDKNAWDLPSSILKPVFCGISSDNFYMYRISKPYTTDENKNCIFEIYDLKSNQFQSPSPNLPNNMTVMDTKYNEMTQTFTIVLLDIGRKQIQFAFYDKNANKIKLSKKHFIPAILYSSQAAITNRNINDPDDRRTNIAAPARFKNIMSLMSWNYLNNELRGISPIGGLVNDNSSTEVIYNPSEDTLKWTTCNPFEVNFPALIKLAPRLEIVPSLESFIPDFYVTINEKIKMLHPISHFDFINLRWLRYIETTNVLYVTDILPYKLLAVLRYMNNQYYTRRTEYTNILADALYVYNAQNQTAAFKKLTHNDLFVQQVSKPILEWYPLYKELAQQSISENSATQEAPSQNYMRSIKNTLASIRRGTVLWWGKATDFCSRHPALCKAGLVAGVVALGSFANYLLFRAHGINTARRTAPKSLPTAP